MTLNDTRLIIYGYDKLDTKHIEIFIFLNTGGPID
jgi:hypothetical protein